MEFLGLGVLIAAAVVVPLLLGLYLDSAAHRAPVFFFIGLFVGVVGAVLTMYVRLRRYL
jgi:F0F1-type ATP synthase assembly protein I